MKSWAFHAFPALFRHTNVYRRWQYFSATHDPAAAAVDADPASDRIVTGDVAGDVSDKRYIADLFARATGSQRDCYMGPSTRPPPLHVKAKAIAFYLPQFHPVPENDEWWGRGFTEWTNVSKAVPQFLGHDQPHLPGELGFYDLRIVDVMRRQAELAKLYGLHGFCFHHYWFSGRRLLERPLDQLIANKDIDLPFCVCWANENWTRRWDGHDHDVLLAQNYALEDDLAFIVDLVPYLRDPRYIKIDGKPLIVVYRPSLLPDCKRTLGVWREYCRTNGIGEVLLTMVQFDVDDPRDMGFDAAVEFPPHKLARSAQCINDQVVIINPDYAGYVVDYDELASNGENWPVPEYSLFKGVSPRWDNEARKPAKGYTFAGSTPQRYGRWLAKAVEYSNAHPVCGESLVFINAWNEWAEGAHLEPDRAYGYAYLEATRGALETTAEKRGVLVVSHDAHPHGAQYLALNMARELARMGLEVHVALLGPGVLEDQFEEVTTVHRLYDGRSDPRDLFRRLRAAGFGLALANTTVAGSVVAPLKNAGFNVVSLIHELPGVIRDMGLTAPAGEIGRHADAIVVSSTPVHEGIRAFIADAEQAKLQMRPQGLYTRSRYLGGDDAERQRARAALRAKLGLAKDARVVLTVGYADKRKGVDLLVRIAQLCVEQDPRMHFVWVGHWEVGIQHEVMDYIRRCGLERAVTFVGFDSDTDDYYAGADLYALTSREDPFPSVVLESLAVGTPIVAFEGTGGGADLVGKGYGAVVPAFDARSFADALMSLQGDDVARDRIGARARQLVETEFSFRSYMLDLLRIGGQRLPTVSVVVPNYNYGRYLQERLESVVNQRFPIYEIIVLDDASTDDSLARLRELHSGLSPQPRLVVNERNSGSVFRQWLAGVQCARGDYVWIAEADDLASPEFLETIVRAMEKSPEALMGYCQSRQIDSEGRILANDYLDYTRTLSESKWREAYVATGDEEVSAGMAVKNTIPNVSAVVFRREQLLRVLTENMDEILAFRVAGDWLVYLHLLREGAVVFDPRSMNSHRRHVKSVTLDTDLEQHLGEVLALQSKASTMFSLDPRVTSQATHYAGELRRQFGLVEAE
ncbi:glycoside hydrolase family 99-like domain-containing protein [Pseudoxanthomonas mexicana]|uniref:glycoside hydrolase family 99-like domain-containing protein n=1 Tax=Pseudoxanthomonas mexicana TaxID=128785 RepID=UPI001E48B934|nr:glycoside hydrolase family 99-like domain-containing protein [Pseudoxanthomonas mexicana]